MKPGYMDADVILRYLTGDSPDLADRAAAMFLHAGKEAARGRETLVLAEITLAEVVWVLQRFYKFEKNRIAQALLAFMELPGLHVPDKSRFQQALYLYGEHNLGFGDALLGARALSAGPALVYSFDSHFRRIPSLSHHSPE
jgi:uncharacterized protein